MTYHQIFLLMMLKSGRIFQAVLVSQALNKIHTAKTEVRITMLTPATSCEHLQTVFDQVVLFLNYSKAWLSTKRLFKAKSGQTCHHQTPIKTIWWEKIWFLKS